MRHDNAFAVLSRRLTESRGPRRVVVEMGRDRMPAFRVNAYTYTGRVDTFSWDMAWGRPNAASAERLRQQSNKQFMPGGSNAHIKSAGGGIDGYSKIEIIRQQGGQVVAVANAPAFELMPESKRTIREGIDWVAVTVMGLTGAEAFGKTMLLARSMGMIDKRPTGTRDGFEFVFKYLRQAENFADEMQARGLDFKMDAGQGNLIGRVKGWKEPYRRRTKTFDVLMGESKRPARKGGHLKESIHVKWGTVLDANDLPEDCIADCSHGGSVDADVAHWVDRLNFTVDPEDAKRYLKCTGMDPDDIDQMDAETLAHYVMWMACCDIAEYDGDDPDGGMFVMEG